MNAPMQHLARLLASGALGLGLAAAYAPALPAVEVPPRGSCPPYPLQPGQDGAVFDDAVPRDFRYGERIPMDQLARLQNYLPRQVWNLRDTFFYEGMEMEIGPCHRRYPVPGFFTEATAASKARLDEEGNLLDYSGTGLPFRWEEIEDEDPMAGWKWAWNYRYRYQGSGYRGEFRIRHVLRRGRTVENFTGTFYLLPLHGVPGAKKDTLHERYWAGGRFLSPPVSRGIAWRQAHPVDADTNPNRSDEIWVWLPDARRVRRSAPTAIDGVYLPSHDRASTAAGDRFAMQEFEAPDPSIAATEHTRRGLTGLMLRPNAYRFGFMRSQDVIAPINSANFGYPSRKDRNYGTSGLSVATDRWEIRRAVVIRGVRKVVEGKIASVTLWLDALTQQPLYMITSKANNHLAEVGIMVGRFSGDDAIHPKWQGSGKGFGTILPVGATFYVSGEGGWMRESYEIRSDPPDADKRSDYTSTIKLQRGR
jgi:hypothetical protein